MTTEKQMLEMIGELTEAMNELLASAKEQQDSIRSVVAVSRSILTRVEFLEEHVGIGQLPIGK